VVSRRIQLLEAFMQSLVLLDPTAAMSNHHGE
jgi:hypothetical protein